MWLHCRPFQTAAHSFAAILVFVCFTTALLYLALATSVVDTYTIPRHHLFWCRHWLLSLYVRTLLLTPYLANVIPVLLVVIVPQLVPIKYVSTTLGAHKSVSASIVSRVDKLIIML